METATILIPHVGVGRGCVPSLGGAHLVYAASLTIWSKWFLGRDKMRASCYTRDNSARSAT